MKLLTTWFVPQNPHEKKRDSIICLKKVIIRKVNFIHSDIEELAESLIEFSIKVRRFNFKKNDNLNLKVKWNHHTTECSLNMSKVNINQISKVWSHLHAEKVILFILILKS